jgi:hypothetical protein
MKNHAQRGEMAQTMYAHMNKKKKERKTMQSTATEHKNSPE